MKKLLFVSVLIVTLLSTLSLAKNMNGDIHIYTIDTTKVKVSPQMLEEALKNANFSIGINSDVEAALYNTYKQDNYIVFNTMSLFHNEHSIALVKEHPDAGVLLPMGLAMYQKNDDTHLRIVVLRQEAQAKLIGANPKELKMIEDKLLKVLTTLFPSAKHSFNDEKLDESRKLLTKYALDLKGRDWEDVKDDLEEEFEEGFDEVGFVMPSYFDHMQMLGKESPFDFFVTYSICKLEVLHAATNIRPESTAFAPCTTMIYKKKDEDKIVIGFTSVYNWFQSARVSDKDSVALLMESQIAFEAVVKRVTGNAK